MASRELANFRRKLGEVGFNINRESLAQNLSKLARHGTAVPPPSPAFELRYEFIIDTSAPSRR
jgi:hypothetical protein